MNIEKFISSHGTVIEVGAHDGSTLEFLTRQFPFTKFYGFEPVPELAQKLRNRYSDRINYEVIESAVSDVRGPERFNVAGTGDWGCGSLLSFNKGLDKTWPGRTDFVVTDKITVHVWRLDDFMDCVGIDFIDFLHVDAQGFDLKVLRSLGAYTSRLKAGVIEVPQSDEVALYRGQHSRQDALEFLEAHGFDVVEIESQQNEDNVYFKKSDL